jgi:hypothetical protein
MRTGIGGRVLLSRSRPLYTPSIGGTQFLSHEIMLVSDASANFATVAAITAVVAPARLLLYPQNRVLCRLGDSEFDHGRGWNLDFLLGVRIEAGARLPFLLHQLAKSRQDEFAILFDRFVGDVAERIEEYSSGSFVGLGGSTECNLKFSFGHV